MMVAFILGLADVFLFISAIRYTYELNHNDVMIYLSGKSDGGIYRRVFFVLGIIGTFWLVSLYTIGMNMLVIPVYYGIFFFVCSGLGLILIFKFT